MRILLAAILLVTVIACRRPRDGHADTGTTFASPDSLRGVVAVVGNTPNTIVSLTAADGRIVVVHGDVLPELRAASGLEVMLFGSHAGTTRDGVPRETPVMHGDRYIVRAVDGAPAHDGMLRFRNGVFLLERWGQSAVILTTVPDALRKQVGARVYWVGAFDRAPLAYGVLRIAPTS